MLGIWVIASYLEVKAFCSLCILPSAISVSGNSVRCISLAFPSPFPSLFLAPRAMAGKETELLGFVCAYAVSWIAPRCERERDVPGSVWL
jgi:hypothetical protein